MKILQLAEKLKNIYDDWGDIDVMISDDEGGLWEMRRVDFDIAEKDEYPKSWNIPDGHKFVRLEN